MAERARLRPGAAVGSGPLVEALSAEDPEDEDAWAAFADAQVRELRCLCRYVDLGGGWAARPEAESPGCELVLLAEAGELHGLEEPASLPAHALLMRHDPAEGWRVAELR